MPVELLLPGRRVPAPPMPSYVKLAEAFGVGAGTSLFDKSRYRSHGAITTATWVAGLHGFALDFVSANPDYVEIPAVTSPQVDFTTQDFSLIARVYPDSLATQPTVFTKARGAGNSWYFVIRANGAVWLATNGTLGLKESKSAAGDVVINTWYTVGFSRAGLAVTIFVNGIDVTAVPATHETLLGGAGIVRIGTLWNGAQPFDGRMEFLRVFGGIALVASEHLAWHNALA